MIAPELAAVETHCIVCGAIVPPERTRHKSTTCTEEHAAERKLRLKRGDPSCKCVVCTADVPADRAAHRAITCSPEHKKLRKRSVRARVDIKRCRVCSRPATPVERSAFRRFRKLELSRPDLLYPRPWQQWQEAGLGTLEEFAVYLRKMIDSDDVTLDATLGLMDRRNKEAPGGGNTGRPRIKWEGGDPECDHKLPILRVGKRTSRKAPLPSNRCRKCSALRVGMEEKKPEPETTEAAA